MTDEQTPAADNEAAVTFSFPDEITGRIWNAYAKGRQAYWKEHDEKDGGNGLMADYAASMAVIDAKFIHVKGPAKVLRYLHMDPDDVPLAWIGLVTTQVAKRIEAEMNAPLGQATNS